MPQKPVGVIVSGKVRPRSETEVRIAISGHDDVEVVSTTCRSGLQLSSNQVCKDKGQVFFFDTACADGMVAVGTTNRAGASMTWVNNNSSFSHFILLFD